MMSYPTLTTLEVECPACEGHGIVTDEGGLYGVADRRFAKWIDCVECEGIGSIEMEIDRRTDLAVAMVR